MYKLQYMSLTKDSYFFKLKSEQSLVKMLVKSKQFGLGLFFCAFT